jgi:hypothetical protein
VPNAAVLLEPAAAMADRYATRDVLLGGTVVRPQLYATWEVT